MAPQLFSGHGHLMLEVGYRQLLLRVAAVGCLLGICATFYLVFGLFGYVHAIALNSIVVLTLVMAAGFFVWQYGKILGETNWLGRIVWLGIMIILLAEVVLGCLPPIARDELTHHLAIPRLYANAGRIIEVPMAPYAYYPMLLDMLYTPWVYWGYDFVPKLVHALFAWLTALALFAYLAMRMSALYGLLGMFFYLSLPSILRLSHWGYIDLGISFYSTVALLCLLLWRERRTGTLTLALAGFSLGFALATKPNGLVAALIITILFVLMIVKPPLLGWLKSCRDLLVFGASAALPYAPWLIKNWLQTGNPFFPLLGSLFAANADGATAVASFSGFGIFEKRAIFYNENIWQIIFLPLRVFISGQDDNPQYFDGVLTPVLLLFLPWAFKGQWLSEKRYLAAFAGLFFLYAIVLVDMRIRYILLIVPPLVALLVFGVFNVYLRIKQPAYLYAALGLFALWHGSYLIQYFRDLAPSAYLTGEESREQYLARLAPEYPVFHFINTETPKTARIYLLFIGRRAYYSERAYFHDGGELPGFLLSAIRSAASAEQVGETLKENRISDLMVREDLLRDFLSHNLTAAEIDRWNKFATQGLTLRFHQNGYSVYELHG